MTKSFQANQGCIALAKNFAHHNRTKQLDIEFHFLREKVNRERIARESKPTEEMIVNGLTKALSRDKHTKLLTGLFLAT